MVSVPHRKKKVYFCQKVFCIFHGIVMESNRQSNTSIRLLFIFDKMDVPSTILQSLKEAGFSVHSHQADSRSSLISALDLLKWDIIISRYQLKDYDSISALSLLQSKEIEIPFLVYYDGSEIDHHEALDDLKRIGVRDIIHESESQARMVGIVRREIVLSKLRQKRKAPRLLLAEREIQQATLASLTQLALQGIDLPLLFESATKAGAEVLNADFCEILEIDTKERIYRAKSLHGETESLLLDDFDSPYNLVNFVLSYDGPYAVDDLQTETIFKVPSNLLQKGYRCGLFVPVRLKDKNYGIIAVLSKEYLLFWENDKHFLQSVAFVLAAAVDRKLSESELLKQGRFFRAIIENSFDGVILANTDAVIRYVTPSIGRILGYSPREFLEIENLISVVHPQDIESFKSSFQRVASNQESVTAEIRIKHKDGRDRWIEFVWSNLLNDNVVNAIIGNFRDISLRKEAEVALQQSESLFRQLAENINAVFHLRDIRTNRLIYVSSAFEQLWGISVDSLYANPELYFSTMSKEDIDRHLLYYGQETESTEEIEFQIERPDGQIRWIRTRFYPIKDQKGHIYRKAALSEDITSQKHIQMEREMLESSLAQSQKLEAIGTLASGVAHEINNPLMGMINFAQLIKDASPDETLNTYSDAIIEEGRRISTIVRDLLDFARKDADEFAIENPAELVNKAISLMNPTLRKERITIEAAYQEDLPEIKCKGHQIQQVLLNLLDNAKFALIQDFQGENSAKKIIVKVFTDQDDATVCISVENPGSGIPKDHAARIFDPFFTTKPRGIGTGLGLSISYGIINKHGGNLRLETEPGKFARFIIELPSLKFIGGPLGV